MSSKTGGHDPTRYQGRKFAYLLLAFAVPAGLLYLRLVFGLAATDTRVSVTQSVTLTRWSTVALLLFFISQLASAVYVQQLVPKPTSVIGQVLRYLGVLVLCLFLSITGMTILEAFGVNFFLRAGWAQ